MIERALACAMFSDGPKTTALKDRALLICFGTRLPGLETDGHDGVLRVLDGAMNRFVQAALQGIDAFDFLFSGAAKGFGLHRNLHGFRNALGQQENNHQYPSHQNTLFVRLMLS